VGGKELPSKTRFTIRPGDTLRIETPGGGGWGAADDSLQVTSLA
jgi:N-methylhydantoinase B